MTLWFKTGHSDSTALHLVLVSVIQLTRSDCSARARHAGESWGVDGRRTSFP